MPYIYAFCIFLSAFLLFQIQPMIGKYILPWFGGTPSVWSTVLLFFQTLLIGGYAYAYGLLSRLRERQQGLLHLIFLGLSLVLLIFTALSWPSPLTPDASAWLGGMDQPILAILRILAASTAIPFLLLSSNSTLMQAWSNRDNQNQAPYRLYALSNTGSLLALISYPIILERFFPLTVQAYLWTGGFILFAISAAYLSLKTYRWVQTADHQAGSDIQPGINERPGASVHALWIGLAACASVLLISMTSQITQEVAVIPFLWVLPLTIYLLTFILAFSGGKLYSRQIYLIAFFALLVISRMLLNIPSSNILIQILFFMLLLFISCMLSHNELYKLRPHPRFLPSFYLMIAIGGAVGGILVTLLAPFLFSTGFWELQWGLIACGLLLTVIIYREQSKPRPREQSKGKRSGRSRRRSKTSRRTFNSVVIVSLVITLLLSLYVVYYMRSISAETLMASRNFYGVLRIWELTPGDPKLTAHQLTHGKTVHGFQFQTEEFRALPTTYYSEDSGVGLTFSSHPLRPGNLHVGALGLGIGVIATYGHPGDSFHFYEINPDVILVAEGEGGYFYFLKNSKADIQVVPGDGRVSLESELSSDGPQNFDLLVLDAFSGDTIPLHLLTKEAFEVYLKHLKEGGIIAINASNRYFDLVLEIYKLADAFNLSTALIEHSGDGLQSYDSVWMLLTTDQAFLNQPVIADNASPRPSIPPNLPIWTDDFSNLIQILK